MEVQIPLSYFIAGLTIFGMIAGSVIWLYATFITRTEAAKMEQTMDRLILAFKEVFNERFVHMEDKMKCSGKRRARAR